MSQIYQGACFCGAVELTVSGDPEAMGYCHCRSCRSWSGGPVNAFTLWKPEAVKVTKGGSEVATYAKTEASHRQYCRKCGGHLMTAHPGFGLVDVFAATLPTLDFKPGVHVNYAETVLPMKDGLPKLKDFPAELGGSGEMAPE
ncbi:GFA family protein [Acidocella facilis]|uniref:GFA family protein n=1 Tax=Acidocella facilis TaxID=525 RepID=UPI00047ECF9B|nr:GFA family protein [Acidocella facilis]